VSNVVRVRPNVAVPLNNATLQLHRHSADVPSYDRSALTPRIVHIGVGGFHRAHQAVYLDDLASLNVSTEWGLTGVSLRHREIRDALESQDGLYTVVQRGNKGDTARVVGSICRSHYAREEPDAVLAALTDERTRLVTLTITGNGYFIIPGTGEFDASHGDVIADLCSGSQFATAWAYLAEALDRRRRGGIPPFTVLSCDNLPDSGQAACTALVSFAALRDESLAHWIKRNVAFPSSMVDRITPQTGPSELNLVEQRFGIIDRSPVVTEQYSQWVIEDTFSNGRPPLEEAGVEFVADVSGHKLTKTRLLNGIHCAVAYLATLAGYERTHEAMGDSIIYCYAEQLMREEIAPLLPAVPGLHIQDYCTTLLHRLSNRRISDQLSRLAARGSVKMPAYLLPSLQEAMDGGRPHTLLLMAVAGWVRYLYGYDLKGVDIHIQDPQARVLTTLATMGKGNPKPLLHHEVFGNLRSAPQFVHRLCELIPEIETHGVVPTLRRRLAGDHRELMRG
jgi:mannitol 2-dehydrogenase